MVQCREQCRAETLLSAAQRLGDLKISPRRGIHADELAFVFDRQRAHMLQLFALRIARIQQQRAGSP